MFRPSRWILLAIWTASVILIKSQTPVIPEPTRIPYFAQVECDCQVTTSAGTQESWSFPRADQNSPVIQKASGGTNLSITVTQNPGSPACTACAYYRCRFFGISGANETVEAIAWQTAGNTQIFNCTMPDWGSKYPAEPIRLSLYKGNYRVPISGTAAILYIEEEIFSVNQTILDSAGAAIAITGSGFRTDPAASYSCFLFGPQSSALTGRTPSTAWTPWRPRHAISPVNSFGFPGLQGTPFVPTSTTSGSCHVSWPYEATGAHLTVLHTSQAFDLLLVRRTPPLRAQTALPPS
jgi:hypothetical protein